MDNRKIAEIASAYYAEGFKKGIRVVNPKISDIELEMLSDLVDDEEITESRIEAIERQVDEFQIKERRTT